MAPVEPLIGSRWQAFDGSTVGTVGVAGPEDVEVAFAAAERGAAVWRRTPAHERMTIPLRAAESGKTITEATGEAARSGDLIRLAAFEGTQLYGETLPLDANRGTGQDKVGFTLRRPCGVVVAITPFNHPALLVLHTLAPALAAGNAVVLEPATSTPLTALELAECFVDAGLPEGVLLVLVGVGAVPGDALVTDPRARKISFTGATATGEHLARVAGVKKLSLEWGASCPFVVLPDADLELAAGAHDGRGHHGPVALAAGQDARPVRTGLRDGPLTFVDAARGVADVLAGRSPAAIANPDWNHRKATA
ncbi:aldehyde dehydrogenase family protein [Streptomyces mirabilis]|uniref:aldehyde dehydrogenase family protein n=1 Tax=Streptomyces mirabilis TaxID=68239 RepID=UPI003695AEFD